MICVLGMHRSGTSLTTKLLNICGVYLGGDEELLGPRKGNEKGHWESKKILEINKAILERFGGSAAKPPVFPKGWEESSSLDGLRQRAKAFVRDMNRRSEVWGWKDPRTCLTLPFWKNIIKEKINFVIPVRSAFDVAQSLNLRTGEPLIEGAYLWLEYWLAIKKNTSREKRIFIPFSFLMRDCNKELDKILAFIDDSRITREGRDREIRDYVQPSMYHFCEQSRNESLNIKADGELGTFILEEMRFCLRRILKKQKD